MVFIGENGRGVDIFQVRVFAPISHELFHFGANTTTASYPGLVKIVYLMRYGIPQNR